MKQNVLVAALLAFVAFSGCADSGNDTQSEDIPDLGLEATNDTGIIVGYVVDTSLRFVVNAEVTVEAAGETLSFTTGEDGAFGFEGLEPGDYQVFASKLGFITSSATATVVAGVSEPELTQLTLVRDPKTSPFIDEFSFNGFIECSFSLVAVGFAACNVLADEGIGNDVFMFEYDISGVPDLMQSEMVWDSTQTAGDRMTILYSYEGGTGQLYQNYAEDVGTSPIMINANKTTMVDNNITTPHQGLIRVFNAPVQETDTGDPIDGDDCIERPVLTGCTTGVGMTLQQSYLIYNHLFYHFTPDAGWQYTVDGDFPLPA